MTTITSSTQNIFVLQGRDWSVAFPCSTAATGDYGEAQIRRWAGGPVLATFDVSVDAIAGTVTIAQTADESALVLRDGYYDVQLWHEGQVLPVASGYAKVIAAITKHDEPEVTWPEFNTMTWDEWNRVNWGEFQ